MSPTPAGKSPSQTGFSLVEMIVSMAVLAIIMLVVMQVANGTGALWRATSDKIKSFQNARAAFESLTQTLTQATLNTVYEYYDANGASYKGQSGFVPSVCDRYSELHFVSGPSEKILNGATRNDSSGGQPYPSVTSGHAVFFQAPLGYTLGTDPSEKNLDNLLNAVGYFVEFGSDKDMMAPLIADKIAPHHRYRLGQFIQPTENLEVYKENWAAHSRGMGADWFKSFLSLPVAGAVNPRPVRVLGENVVSMIIRPKRSDKEWALASPKPAPLAKDYLFDTRPVPNIKPADYPNYPSRHQLPPLVGVTLIAVDELSASRLEQKYGDKPPLAEMGLDGLFKITADTNDPKDFNDDLETLKDEFAKHRINYRIFDTEIMIQGSKWSQN